MIEHSPIQHEDSSRLLRFIEQFTQPPVSDEEEQLLLDQLDREVLEKYKVSLVIGRFQPLHYGHIYLFKQALTVASTMVVGIGSANVRNTDNPFTYIQRERMVREVLARERLLERVEHIVPLDDDPNDDVWLRKTLEQTGSDIDVVVGNNEWVNSIFEQAQIKTLPVPMLKRATYEGKAIRHLLRKEGILT
jgi:nicotinamide-nucleotide adenylyltransferase